MERKKGSDVKKIGFRNWVRINDFRLVEGRVNPVYCSPVSPHKTIGSGVGPSVIILISMAVIGGL